ncbi:hypothetical protein SAMN05216267_101366 [Actinacidiphila rubida]|uniref:Uncharacterized protein n=1 Tax=Actinacidiphila rubida TaxID=310780 RepID=A0A1H8KLD4_9ACTN|nr:hypothetical protein SAMN05216267_101366 [Actinacidiphila rubida]
MPSTPLCELCDTASCDFVVTLTRAGHTVRARLTSRQPSDRATRWARAHVTHRLSIVENSERPGARAPGAGAAGQGVSVTAARSPSPAVTLKVNSLAELSYATAPALPVVAVTAGFRGA